MLNKKDKHQIIDDSYNRWAIDYDDEDAPLWFVEDEKKHWRPPPINTRKEVHEVRTQRDPSINEKSIKKVLEAKMRRKKRLEKKLTKIKQKSDNLHENDGDINARVLNNNLKKIQAEWNKTKKNAKGSEKKYVVVKKGKSARMGLDKNSKKSLKRVKVKAVDARMKKDKRNSKIKEKNLKRKRK